MSIEAMNWAMGHMRATDLEPSDRFVLLILANRADPEGICWPSIRYISRHTGYADSTIRECCKRIASKGLLAIEHQQRQDGAKTANRYRLPLETPPPPATGDTPPATGGAHRRPSAVPPPTTGGHKTVDVDVLSLTGDRPSAEALACDESGKPIMIPITKGQEWPVLKSYLDELERAYPAVDGPRTLLEIRMWALSNESQRWTKKGAPRGINRWFEKEQNRTGRPH